MSENPLVSVIVLTYGHEKYIAQALDSILMQKVDFEYEIIVGEDCSPDGTRKILKEYEKKYPDKFVMVYRDKNIGTQRNSWDIPNRAKGKYLAYLEGDDYWISDKKLQMQVDFLEQHDDFIATAHRVIVVDKNGYENPDLKYPECPESLYTLKHFQDGYLPGQLASMVEKNFYKDKLFDFSIMANMDLMPRDRIKTYLLASHGNIYCFPEVMSAYRYVTDSGYSYSAMVRRNRNNINYLEDQIRFYKAMTKHSHEHIKNITAVETIERLYLFRAVYTFLRWPQKIFCYHLKEAWKDIWYRRSTICFVIIRIFSLAFNKAFRKKQM